MARVDGNHAHDLFLRRADDIDRDAARLDCRDQRALCGIDSGSPDHLLDRTAIADEADRDAAAMGEERVETLLEDPRRLAGKDLRAPWQAQFCIEIAQATVIAVQALTRRSRGRAKFGGQAVDRQPALLFEKAMPASSMSLLHSVPSASNTA